VQTWAKEKLPKEEINNLLLAKTFGGETAWHIAAKEDKLDFLEEVWDWAK
jgi:hypothetical protein